MVIHWSFGENEFEVGRTVMKVDSVLNMPYLQRVVGDALAETLVANPVPDQDHLKTVGHGFLGCDEQIHVRTHCPASSSFRSTSFDHWSVNSTFVDSQTISLDIVGLLTYEIQCSLYFMSSVNWRCDAKHICDSNRPSNRLVVGGSQEPFALSLLLSLNPETGRVRFDVSPDGIWFHLRGDSIQTRGCSPDWSSVVGGVLRMLAGVAEAFGLAHFEKDATVYKDKLAKHLEAKLHSEVASAINGFMLDSPRVEKLVDSACFDRTSHDIYGNFSLREASFDSSDATGGPVLSAKVFVVVYANLGSGRVVVADPAGLDQPPWPATVADWRTSLRSYTGVDSRQWWDVNDFLTEARLPVIVSLIFNVLVREKNLTVNAALAKPLDAIPKSVFRLTGTLPHLARMEAPLDHIGQHTRCPLADERDAGPVRGVSVVHALFSPWKATLSCVNSSVNAPVGSAAPLSARLASLGMPTTNLVVNISETVGADLRVVVDRVLVCGNPVIEFSPFGDVVGDIFTAVGHYLGSESTAELLANHLSGLEVTYQPSLLEHGILARSSIIARGSTGIGFLLSGSLAGAYQHSVMPSLPSSSFHCSNVSYWNVTKSKDGVKGGVVSGQWLPWRWGPDDGLLAWVFLYACLIIILVIAIVCKLLLVALKACRHAPAHGAGALQGYGAVALVAAPPAVAPLPPPLERCFCIVLIGSAISGALSALYFLVEVSSDGLASYLGLAMSAWVVVAALSIGLYHVKRGGLSDDAKTFCMWILCFSVALSMASVLVRIAAVPRVDAIARIKSDENHWNHTVESSHCDASDAIFYCKTNLAMTNFTTHLDEGAAIANGFHSIRALWTPVVLGSFCAFPVVHGVTKLALRQSLVPNVMFPVAAITQMAGVAVVMPGLHVMASAAFGVWIVLLYVAVLVRAVSPTFLGEWLWILLGVVNVAVWIIVLICFAVFTGAAIDDNVMAVIIMYVVTMMGISVILFSLFVLKNHSPDDLGQAKALPQPKKRVVILRWISMLALCLVSHMTFWVLRSDSIKRFMSDWQSEWFYSIFEVHASVIIDAVAGVIAVLTTLPCIYFAPSVLKYRLWHVSDLPPGALAHAVVGGILRLVSWALDAVEIFGARGISDVVEDFFDDDGDGSIVLGSDGKKLLLASQISHIVDLIAYVTCAVSLAIIIRASNVQSVRTKSVLVLGSLALLAPFARHIVISLLADQVGDLFNDRASVEQYVPGSVCDGVAGWFTDVAYQGQMIGSELIRFSQLWVIAGSALAMALRGPQHIMDILMAAGSLQNERFRYIVLAWVVVCILIAMTILPLALMVTTVLPSADTCVALVVVFVGGPIVSAICMYNRALRQFFSPKAHFRLVVWITQVIVPLLIVFVFLLARSGGNGGILFLVEQIEKLSTWSHVFSVVGTVLLTSTFFEVVFGAALDLQDWHENTYYF